MPEWKHEIEERLKGLHLRPEREAEIIDELSSHLQDRYAELQAQGATPRQAFQDVLAELDSTDLVPELQVSEDTPRCRAGNFSTICCRICATPLGCCGRLPALQVWWLSL